MPRLPINKIVVVNRPITRIITINRGLKGEDFTPSTTDSLAEGIANLYFTATRAKSAAVADSITDGVTDVAPSQNAVFDALAPKANLALADFTDLRLATRSVAAFEQGSNANGYWCKWYDKSGNVLACIQIGNDTTVGSTTLNIPFPTAFPDANYRMWAWNYGSGNTFTVVINNSQSVWDGYARNFSGALSTTTLCRYIAVWIKS
jgi:hypothetical protein